MVASGGPCLKLAAVTWPGLLEVSGDPENPKLTGPLVEMLEIFGQALGTCLKFVSPKDMRFGSEYPNGTWSGIVGMLNANEADLSAVVLSIDAGRSDVIDFSTPVFIDEQILLHKRPVLESDLVGFTKPYTSMVWWLLILTIVFVSLGLLIVQVRRNIVIGDQQQFSGRLAVKQEVHLNTEQTLYDLIWNSAYMALAALIAQSIPRIPRGNILRIIAGLWILAVLILGAVYRSNLKAMLILPKLRLPFDSMEELLQTNIKCYVAEGTMLYHSMMHAQEGTLLARLRHQSVSDRDTVGAIANLIRGKHASLVGRIVSTHVVHNTFSLTKTCPLYFAKEPFWSATSVAYAFPKGSPLKQKVDNILWRLKEFGIMNRLYEKSIENARMCQKEDFTRPNDALRPFKMKDFYGTLILYSLGMFLSFVIFLLESSQKDADEIEQRPGTRESDN